MTKSKKYTGIYLHHLKNGDITYYAQYIDENRLNTKIKIGKKTEGITEKFASIKRNELVHLVRLGENPFRKVEVPTFDKIANDYFLHLLDKGRSEENTKCSRRRYEMHIKPYLHNKLVSNISVDILNKMKRDKIQTLAPRTVNEFLSLISIIINFANKFYNLKIDNHISIGRVVKYKEDNIRDRYLTLEEIDILLDAVKDYKQVNLAVRFALTTGARIGTIMSIKLKDIDPINRTVHLTDHKNCSTYVGYLHEKYFPDFEFLIERKNNRYIFEYNNKKIDGGSLQLQYRTITNELFNQGLHKDDRKNRVVFHTLRHTYCSQLCIAGVPIYTVQKLVNHKTIMSTIRYSKLENGVMFDAVKKAFD